MHDDQAGAGVGRDARNVGLPLQAMHVVDDVSACFHREPRRLGAVGIDGNQSLAFRRQRFDDREDARLFLTGRNLVGAGACRFPADIDDGGALADHYPRLRQRAVQRVEFAAVRKTVRGDVQNPHQYRLGA